MKIALLYPSWTGEYGEISNFAKKGATWPPLNLAYLGAIAENQGHEVRIFDGEGDGLSLEGMVDQTSQYNPDLIGITATTPFYHIATELASKLKETSKTPIVIGGPHITVLKEEVFDRNFDYGFIGEAESAWSKFLSTFENCEDITSIGGILYRRGGEIKMTGPCEPVQDMNSLPVPARHLLNAENYTLGTLEGRKKMTSIMTVRGCPYKCIFCSTEVFGNDTRRRDPEKVVEEMKDCVEKYGIEHFMFLDDTLTLNKKHISDICDKIIDEDLDITFEGSTRANLVDEGLVKKMKDAGLIRLSFGLESVNKDIRKVIRKEVPLESYEVANKLTNKYEIETLNSCMIGLPGETEETVKETLKFLRESKEIRQANISIAVPYPGTELYKMAINQKKGLKLMTEDFSQFRRYNAAVMQVGDLSPEDLIDLQNEAFASIYMAPWRWEPMIKKSGIEGAMLTVKRLMKCIDKGQNRFLTDNALEVE